jgi:hypothetical protein
MCENAHASKESNREKLFSSSAGGERSARGVGSGLYLGTATVGSRPIFEQHLNWPAGSSNDSTPAWRPNGFRCLSDEPHSADPPTGRPLSPKRLWRVGSVRSLPLTSILLVEKAAASSSTAHPRPGAQANPVPHAPETRRVAVGESDARPKVLAGFLAPSAPQPHLTVVAGVGG